jgi:hypothetical protein
MACSSLSITIEISRICNRAKSAMGTVVDGSSWVLDWSFCVAKYA